MRCGRFIVVTILAAMAPMRASAWTWRAPDRVRFAVGVQAFAVSTDAVVFGALRPAPHQGSYAVIRKLSSRTGRALWQQNWRGPGPEWSDEIHQLTVASNGDVLAAGIMTGFVVRRLDARTGGTRWQTTVHGAANTASWSESAYAIAVAPNGDVIVGGVVNESDTPPHHGNFAVVALDGATGRERWRYVAGGATASGYVDQLVVDPVGDVFAAGSLGPDGSSVYGVTIVKISGDTGTLRWERTTDDFVQMYDMAVDGHGDAYLAGTGTRNGGRDGGNDLGVAKITGATGTTEWMARQSDTERWQTATRVVVDGDAVFATGMTNDGTGEAWTDEGWVFRVLRLDPATGNVQWNYRAGGGGAPGFASHLAIVSNGAILAAGLRGTRATCADAFVTALDRTTGQPRWSKRFDGPLATRQCHPECEEARDCPAVDDDGMDGLGVDARGRILVAGHLVGGTTADESITSFVRMLRP